MRRDCGSFQVFVQPLGSFRIPNRFMEKSWFLETRWARSLFSIEAFSREIFLSKNISRVHVLKKVSAWALPTRMEKASYKIEGRMMISLRTWRGLGSIWSREHGHLNDSWYFSILHHLVHAAKRYWSCPTAWLFKGHIFMRRRRSGVLQVLLWALYQFYCPLPKTVVSCMQFVGSVVIILPATIRMTELLLSEEFRVHHTNHLY
jgi:hypothetical protein